MSADSRQNALMQASELGDVATVRRLVEDPDAGVDLECRTERGETPLMLAAWNGHVDLVRFLLEAGADVQATDREREDALIGASGRPGKAAVLEMLLTGGAHVDRRNASGRTALIEAASVGSEDNAAVLLRYGADRNVVTDEQETALTFAVVNEYRNLVGLLLNAGAAVDARDEKGWTPLTYAVYSGKREIVRRLVEAGADPDQVDGEGNTMLTHVTRSGNTGLIELLRPGEGGGQ